MAALGNLECSVCDDEGCEFCPKSPERKCYCPDDCNCHHPWRTNFCGCKGHESVSSSEIDRLNIESSRKHPVTVEPYPVETFQGFTDSDLEQLLVDTTKELARRQGGSWFRLGPLSDGQYGGPRRYQT